MFRDLVGDGKFVNFDLDGVAQLVETSPPIFRFHELESSFDSILYPNYYEVRALKDCVCFQKFCS